jgi:hypothetical protein
VRTDVICFCNPELLVRNGAITRYTPALNRRVLSGPKVRKYPRIAPKISSAMVLVRLIEIAELQSQISDFSTGIAVLSIYRYQSEICNLKSAMSYRHWRSAEAT